MRRLTEQKESFDRSDLVPKLAMKGKQLIHTTKSHRGSVPHDKVQKNIRKPKGSVAPEEWEGVCVGI